MGQGSKVAPTGVCWERVWMGLRGVGVGWDSLLGAPPQAGTSWSLGTNQPVASGAGAGFPELGSPVPQGILLGLSEPRCQARWAPGLSPPGGSFCGGTSFFAALALRSAEGGWGVSGFTPISASLSLR